MIILDNLWEKPYVVVPQRCLTEDFCWEGGGGPKDIFDRKMK